MSESSSESGDGQADPEGNASLRLDLSLTQEDRAETGQSNWLRLTAIAAGIALAGLGSYGIWRRLRQPGQTWTDL